MIFSRDAGQLSARQPAAAPGLLSGRWRITPFPPPRIWPSRGGTRRFAVVVLPFA